MSESLSRSEVTREWLIRVERDLQAAERLMNPPLPGEAAFHCQQAAEKAIKGLLTWHDIPFPKTHVLSDLKRLIAPIDPQYADLVVEADYLSDYAWEFRYPGVTEDATEKLARDALIMARRVYQAVLARVPKEAHPSHGDHE